MLAFSPQVYSWYFIFQGLIFHWAKFFGSDNIIPQILITDNPRRLWMFSWRGGLVFVSARVKLHFCGACSTISYHCLGLCLLSSCFLGAGQARRRAEFASVVFGHAFSHTAFQTLLALYPSFLSFCLVPQNHRLQQID